MYNIVSSLNDLENIIDYNSPIFCDTETDGLYGKVVTIQFYQEHWQEVAFIRLCKIISSIDDIINCILNKVPYVVFHNAHYDLTVLKNKTLNIEDTFLLAKLAMPTEEKYSLDYLLEKILGYCPYKKLGIDKKIMQKMDWSDDLAVLSEKQIEYACLDVLHLPKLYEKVKKAETTQSYKLDKITLYHCLDFQNNGIPTDKCRIIYEKLKTEAKLNNYDLPVNSNSYKQVREHLNVDYSDEEYLMKMYLRGYSEDAYKIVKNRKHKRTLNFLEKYDKPVVKGHFKPNAKSGRLTSDNNNLQQIPRHLKTIFGYSEQDNKVLVFADYAQLELRTICALLQVKLLEKLFRKGVDVHTHVAHMLFGDIITKKDRTVTKTYNFNLLYGGSAAMICSILIKYGLLVEENEANKHKNKWLNIFPEIRQWQDWCTRQWRKKQLYSTPMGRKYSAKLMTDFMNIRNQGAGAEVSKLALHYLYKDFLVKSHNKEVKLLNFVHDSYLISCDTHRINEVSEALANSMIKAWNECSKNFIIKDLPMPVNVKVGLNWGDIEEDKNLILNLVKE